jgi:hypothetical protein
VASSGQTPLETPLQEAPEQSLLPPIRDERGKLLPHARITKKKLVRDALLHHFQVTPEEFAEIMRLFLLDCRSEDPVIRQAARKELFDRLEGKPVRVVEDESANKPLQRPIINIIVKD